MSFLGGVVSSFTWRRLVAMLVVGFSLPLFQALLGGAPIPPAKCLVLALSAVSNLLVVLGADEAASRGVRLGRVHFCAVLSLLAGNCTIMAMAVAAQSRLGMQFGEPVITAANAWPEILRRGIRESLWGVLALFVFLNRRIAERMLHRVRQAELHRIGLEAQLIESRLAAAQAQVDPRMLFGTLADIRGKLAADAPEADEQLDSLIQRLRTALMRTVAGIAPESDAT